MRYGANLILFNQILDTFLSLILTRMRALNVCFLLENIYYLKTSVYKVYNIKYIIPKS